MKNLQIILLALLASVIASASLANIEEGEYYIKNAVLQKYLQVTNSEAKAGANVEIGAGTGKSNQKWTLKKLSNGYVLLTSKLGDFSLDIANGKDEKGANVNIYYTHTGDAQQFHLLTSSNGNAVFIAPKTSYDDKVVCVYDDKAVDGQNVHIWTNLFNYAQTWIFEKVGGGSGSGSGSGSTNTNTSSNTNAVKSPGCGKSLRLPKTGNFDFYWTKGKRNVKIDIPSNYNNNNAYKLVVGMHCMGGSASGVQQEGYYGLKPLDTGKTTIFVPQKEMVIMLHGVKMIIIYSMNCSIILKTKYV